jgi:hypothetical protein
MSAWSFTGGSINTITETFDVDAGESAILNQNVLLANSVYRVSINYDLIPPVIGESIPPLITVRVGDYEQSFTAVSSGNFFNIDLPTGPTNTLFEIGINEIGSKGVNTDIKLDNVVVEQRVSTTACLDDCVVSCAWGVNATFDCEEVYSNPNFYSGSTINDLPTTSGYTAELSSIATALGLTFSSSDGVGTFTYQEQCEGEYINKSFKVNLTLDITTICT